MRVVNPAKKSEGSGVIVGRTGALVYLLTADHVVAGADGVHVSLFAEKNDAKASKTYRNGRVIARSADRRDLALVRIAMDEKTLSVLRVCPVGAAPPIDHFPGFATGCSEGQAPTGVEYSTLIKRKAREKGDAESAYFWEAPGTITRGRSGGPLIDRRGLVVGICSGTNDGKGYYTHVDEIHRFFKQRGCDWLAEKAEIGPESAGR